MAGFPVIGVASLPLLALLAGTPATAVAGAPEVYEQLKSLVGNWEAQLPGFGTLTSSVRLVSNGKAIEEVIGTPQDNELSVYTLAADKILLTHYCAMTSDGHQVHLQARTPGSSADHLEFVFSSATNLHSHAAPHMRRVLLSMVDRDHYVETWTKTEQGHDTEFELHFERR